MKSCNRRIKSDCGAFKCLSFFLKSCNRSIKSYCGALKHIDFSLKSCNRNLVSSFCCSKLLIFFSKICNRRIKSYCVAFKRLLFFSKNCNRSLMLLIIRFVFLSKVSNGTLLTLNSCLKVFISKLAFSNLLLRLLQHPVLAVLNLYGLQGF